MNTFNSNIFQKQDLDTSEQNNPLEQFLQKYEKLLENENYNIFLKLSIVNIIENIIQINERYGLNIDDNTFNQWIKNIVQISQKDANCIKTIQSFLRNYYYTKFSKELIDLILNPKFSNLQLNEVIKGFAEHLDINDIKIYTHENFDYKQMEQIRLGLKQTRKNELPYDYVITFAKPEIDWKIMYIARKVYSLKKQKNINVDFQFNDLLEVINNTYRNRIANSYNTNELDKFINVITKKVVDLITCKSKIKEIFNELHTQNKNNDNISTKSFKF